MKINLAKSAGLCFGVKRAINCVKETAKLDKKIYMLGDIVHNERLIKEMTALGIKKIKHLSNGKGKILIIRAHGSCESTYKKADKLGYKIIDATCPMVKEIHRTAKKWQEKGYAIIIIGDKNHDEVHGIKGQLKNKALVIDKVDNIPLAKIKKIKKCAIVVQSTQNADKAIKIVKALKKHIKELKFFNTICKPTTLKQEEIKTLPLKNELIFIVGSKTSANTKRLYEISKSLNQRTYWINSGKDIKPVLLKGIKTVGITAGASTPDSTIKEIITRLRKIAGK